MMSNAGRLSGVGGISRGGCFRAHRLLSGEQDREGVGDG